MQPSYPLHRIREFVAKGQYRITETAMQTSFQMGFSDEDIVECVAGHLQETHFYKTMPSEKISGLMQDVYRITYQGFRVYLKMQINRTNEAVIISFKEDESSG